MKGIGLFKDPVNLTNSQAKHLKARHYGHRGARSCRLNSRRPVGTFRSTPPKIVFRNMDLSLMRLVFELQSGLVSRLEAKIFCLNNEQQKYLRQSSELSFCHIHLKIMLGFSWPRLFRTRSEQTKSHYIHINISISLQEHGATNRQQYRAHSGRGAALGKIWAF